MAGKTLTANIAGEIPLARMQHRVPEQVLLSDEAFFALRALVGPKTRVQFHVLVEMFATSEFLGALFARVDFNVRTLFVCLQFIHVDTGRTVVVYEWWSARIVNVTVFIIAGHVYRGWNNPSAVSKIVVIIFFIFSGVAECCVLKPS